MISRNDKDKLIILATLVAMVLLVVVCFYTTRAIPFKYIIAVYLSATVVCWAIITRRYYELYGMKAPNVLYVPIVNCLLTFDRITACLLLTTVGVFCTAGLLQFLPADIIVTLLGEKHAMWFFDRATFVMIITGIFGFWVLIGIGFCGVYRDVRRMFAESVGSPRPKMECINYVLVFIPLVSVAAYSQIISLEKLLLTNGYQEGKKKEKSIELEEVR